jgi:putative PIG3 family NAD(P)H quinone oxidoreductase
MANFPATMQAIAVEGQGKEAKLYLKEIATPKPAAGQVLIKNVAAGINRADTLQASGNYPPPPGAPETLGLETSGTIVALGEGVTKYKEGDEVCALLSGGGYAQYSAAAELCLLPIPKGVSLKDASGLPEVYFTVWANVFDACKLQSGESFLIHGGSSGIGTAVIQLATARGARVYATAGSDEKCDVCRKLGAVRAINYKTEDFEAVLKEETGGKGVNVILDMVGGPYVQKNMNALARKGRMVNIGYQQGTKVEVDFRPMIQKQIWVTASSLRPRSDKEKGLLRDAIQAEVWPLIAAGKIKPVIDSWFPLAKAGEAQARLKTSQHIGKILMEV